MRLHKLHGLGNDFLVVFVDEVPPAAPVLARRLCERRTGVGADGLVLGLDLRGPGETEPAAGVFRVFNADGSEAEVSGNGLRCFADAVSRRLGVTPLVLDAETAAGTRRVQVVRPDDGPDTVCATVEMGPAVEGVDTPADLAARLPEGLVRRWSTVDLGNPHVVFEVAGLDRVDVSEAGPAIEAALGPINVHFIAPRLDRNGIDMLVWERGVGATAACGSGACAAAHAATSWGWTSGSVDVHMPGGVATVTPEARGLTLAAPSTFVAEIEVPS